MKPDTIDVKFFFMPYLWINFKTMKFQATVAIGQFFWKRLSWKLYLNLTLIWQNCWFFKQQNYINDYPNIWSYQKKYLRVSIILIPVTWYPLLIIISTYYLFSICKRKTISVNSKKTCILYDFKQWFSNSK